MDRPPKSSDLNPLDFYVWNQIKNEIDDNRTINTLDQYKDQIYTAFETFRMNSSHFDMILTLMDLHVALCIDANGGVFKAIKRIFFRKAK